MQTDYSADDVAAAASLQFFAYIYVLITTFWTYDYACSLDEEWKFLLVSHWTKVKGLYIVTRYVPFLLLATNLYLTFIPNENSGECRALDNICSGLGILSAVCSESFFILRTCALWNNNKILLAAMLVTFLVSPKSTCHTKASCRCIIQTFVGAAIGVSFATTAPAIYAISAIPGITGCYQSSSSLQLFIPFLLLCAFELGLLTLTLIRAIQNWRITTSRLYIVLVNHNVLYYICGLLFSVANIFTSLLLHYSYHAILHDFQFIVLAILATRMHRHLWQMKRQTHGSDALMQIPMSDMSPTEHTA